jgi:hypothetical protein
MSSFLECVLIGIVVGIIGPAIGLHLIATCAISFCLSCLWCSVRGV